MLRAERERQGLNLAEIAERTRIKPQYLEALETDSFDRLPGRFFARSFTHQYANALGINTPELQARLQAQVAPVEIFAAESEGGAPTPELLRDSAFAVDPLPNGSASAYQARRLTASLVMLVAAVIACGTVFWLWQRSQIQVSSANDGKAAPAEAAVAVAEAPKEVTPPVQVSPPAAQPTNGEAKVDPAQATQQPQVSPAVSESQNPAANTSTAAPNITTPNVPGKLNLMVIAREGVWVRVRVDGKVIVERKLEAGESATASGVDNASILTGNAGGLEIRFNGSDIGPLGPRGQVRTIEFTKEAFKIIEPQKKPDSAGTRNEPVAGA